jgi:hypothetical protein
MNNDANDDKSGKPPAPNPLPTCPYCGTSPARVHSAPFELLPGLMAVTIFCATPGCHKIWTVQIMGPSGQPQKGRIILPN